MKERTDILDKTKPFLAIKCDHGDDRKKAEHKAFLTRKQFGLSQLRHDSWDYTKMDVTYGIKIDKCVYIFQFSPIIDSLNLNLSRPG